MTSQVKKCSLGAEMLPAIWQHRVPSQGLEINCISWRLDLQAVVLVLKHAKPESIAASDMREEYQVFILVLPLRT